MGKTGLGWARLDWIGQDLIWPTDLTAWTAKAKVQRANAVAEQEAGVRSELAIEIASALVQADRTPAVLRLPLPTAPSPRIPLSL